MSGQLVIQEHTDETWIADEHHNPNDEATRTSLRVGSLNVNGVRSKVVAIKQLLQKEGLDVLVLQETRHDSNSKLSFSGYICFETLEEDTGGVLIIARDELKPRLINIFANQTVTIIVHHGKRRTYIQGVYNHQGNSKTLYSVQSEIEQILRNWSNPAIVTAGDFNDLKKKHGSYFKQKHFEEHCPQITWMRQQKMKDNSNRVLESDPDGIYSTEDLKSKSQRWLPQTDHCCLIVEVDSDENIQKYIGTRFQRDRNRISQLFKENWNNLSLLDDYTEWVKGKVKKTPISTRICRPVEFYNDPYTVNWAERDKNFKKEEFKNLITKTENFLIEGNLRKFYQSCKTIFKEMKKANFAKSPITRETSSNFSEYYQNLFQGSNEIYAWNDWIDLNEIEGIDKAIELVAGQLPRKKALGVDLFPDDAESKEKMGALVLRDARRLLERPLSDHLTKSKGILLSKSGKEVVEPKQTRLLNVIPYSLKVMDKIVLQLIQDELWNYIGDYQQGFRKSSTTFKHIQEVMRWLRLGKKGRKQKKYLVFFDLEKAFDSIDRKQIGEVLGQRLKNKELLKLVLKLLTPMDVQFEFEGTHFICKKGVPQGMSISPLLFNTILDHELVRVRLLDHILLAWADDLVFQAHSKTELCVIINKMKNIGKGLKVNLGKSMILPIGDNDFAQQKEFMGIPLGTEVKYLGLQICSTKQRTIEVMKHKLKLSFKKLSYASLSIPYEIRVELVQRVFEAQLLYQVIPFVSEGLIKMEDAMALQLGFWRKLYKVNNSLSGEDLLTVGGMKPIDLVLGNILDKLKSRETKQPELRMNNLKETIKNNTAILQDENKKSNKKRNWNQFVIDKSDFIQDSVPGMKRLRTVERQDISIYSILKQKTPKLLQVVRTIQYQKSQLQHQEFQKSLQQLIWRNQQGLIYEDFTKKTIYEEFTKNLIYEEFTKNPVYEEFTKNFQDLFNFQNSNEYNQERKNNKILKIFPKENNLVSQIKELSNDARGKFLKILQTRHFLGCTGLVKCLEHQKEIGKFHYCFLDKFHQDLISGYRTFYAIENPEKTIQQIYKALQAYLRIYKHYRDRIEVQVGELEKNEKSGTPEIESGKTEIQEKVHSHVCYIDPA